MTDLYGGTVDPRRQLIPEVARDLMASWLRKAYWNAFTLWHVRGESGCPYRPLEALSAIQNRRIKAIVAHAYETVPHYRKIMDEARLRPRDFHTADDLARLPIVTGKDLALEPRRFLSSRYTNGESLKLQSSGTSGFAKEIFYDPAALFLALAHGHRQRLVLARFVGRKFGYREMKLARAASVSFQIRDFYESHSWVPRKVDLKRSAASPSDRFEDTVARCNEFKPDILRGYGSHLGALFRWAWEKNLHLFRPKVIIYGADRMPDVDRRLIETEFGVPVVSMYQAAESLRIGFQCERREGFHLSRDHAAVRVVDAEG
ncbi:MAG: hypothetical protein ACREBC_13055, partial [Pyrinomonadaceae bacterium]